MSTSHLIASPALAETSSCVDSGVTAYFARQEGVGVNLPQRHGVRAYIDPFITTFDICSGGLISLDDSTSGWVSIEPKNAVGTWQILQIGVIKCDIPIYVGVCDHDNQINYFWAEGGCGVGPGAPPDPQDLGDANFSEHEYAIRHHPTASDFRLSIDGINRVIAAYTRDDIECWIQGMRKISWSGERADRGDSLGDPIPPNTDALRFRLARYQSERDGDWKSPNWTVGDACAHRDANSDCEFYSDTGVYMWTTHLP